MIYRVYICDIKMKIDYTIIRSSRKTLCVQVKNAEVIVRAPKNETYAHIEKFINEHSEWIEKQIIKQSEIRDKAAQRPKLTQEDLNELRRKAADVIPGKVQYYAQKIGVTYGRITIRCQHTKWGSCSSKGNLNFNCLLMLMPEEVLDSVVVHELCHRKEMNHSEKFYNEIYKVYPEYDKWNKWLKQNGAHYLNMLP